MLGWGPVRERCTQAHTENSTGPGPPSLPALSTPMPSFVIKLNLFQLPIFCPESLLSLTRSILPSWVATKIS